VLLRMKVLCASSAMPTTMSSMKMDLPFAGKLLLMFEA
jgi:hypothetical protein